MSEEAETVEYQLGRTIMDALAKLHHGEYCTTIEMRVDPNGAFSIQSLHVDPLDERAKMRLSFIRDTSPNSGGYLN